MFWNYICAHKKCLFSLYYWPICKLYCTLGLLILYSIKLQFAILVLKYREIVFESLHVSQSPLTIFFLVVRDSFLGVDTLAEEQIFIFIISYPDPNFQILFLFCSRSPSWEYSIFIYVYIVIKFLWIVIFPNISAL